MECVICKDPVTGYGHNAQPVAEGRCCNTCNDTEVMPMRFNLVFGGEVEGFAPDWSRYMKSSPSDPVYSQERDESN